MSRSPSIATLEDLLAESEWLTRLARRLADSEIEAEDAVQETYLSAHTAQPLRGDGLRPWLATVLRNSLRGRARSDQRRSHREEAAVDPGVELSRPDALLERAQTQHELAGLVLALREPYRRTVLQHVYSNAALADIARREGVALSTVRWRYQEALRNLRAELGERTSLGAFLGPLLVVPTQGVVMAKKSSLTWALICGLLALMTVVGAIAMRSKAGSKAQPESSLRVPMSPSGFASARASRTTTFAQPGLPRSLIAGTVFLQGKTVANARIGLIDPLGVLTDEVRSDGQGAFNLGDREAALWTVVASTPETTAAVQTIDLRAPSVRGLPVRLELRSCDSPIEGIVRDASGGRVAGAQVSKVHSNQVMGASVTSDSLGRYRLCADTSWPGRVELAVIAEGYGTARGVRFAYGGGDASWGLAPEAVVEGVVVDERGTPVSNATVWARDAEGLVHSITTSDRAGQFSLKGLPAGTLTIHGGLQDKRANATPITIESGSYTSGLAVVLSVGRSWNGIVTHDGVPVAGVPIRSTASREVLAVSQKSGLFVAEGLPNSAFDVEVGPWRLTKPTSIPAGAANLDLALEVVPSPILSGVVTQHGHPVAGAIVRVEGAHPTDEVRTEEDGTYVLRGLAPGRWLVLAQDEKGSAFGRTPEPIPIAANGTTTANVDLSFEASVTGQVTRRDETPVAGVVVELISTTRDDMGMARTNADGHFSAGMMMGAGAYAVSIRREHRASGKMRVLVPESPRVELPSHDTMLENFTIVVDDASAPLTGIVLDASGAPAADQMVRLRAESPAWATPSETMTAFDGSFTFRDIELDTPYALAIPTKSSIYVYPGEVTAGDELHVQLPEDGALRIETVGFDSAVGVEVSLLDPEHSDVRTTAQRLDGDSFACDSLMPGRYLVVAAAQGQSASQTVVVTSGQTADVRLSAKRSATVRGQVREYSSQAAITGTTCQVARLEGERVLRTGSEHSVVVDGHGRFELREVPSGNVAVWCSAIAQVTSDGISMLDLAEGDSADTEIVVARVAHSGAATLADLGATVGIPLGVSPRLTGVRSGGPADSAGFQEGDILRKVGGESVEALSPNGIRTLLMNHGAGSRVDVEAERNGTRFSTTWTLGAYSAD